MTAWIAGRAIEAAATCAYWAVHLIVQATDRLGR
jgi:hypothetical protein